MKTHFQNGNDTGKLGLRGDVVQLPLYDVTPCHSVGSTFWEVSCIKVTVCKSTMQAEEQNEEWLQKFVRLATKKKAINKI